MPAPHFWSGRSVASAGRCGGGRRLGRRRSDRDACGGCHKSRSRRQRPSGCGPDTPCPAAGADRPADTAGRRTRSRSHPGPGTWADREACLLRLYEGEAHRLPSSAKKAAAVFSISRSCLRTAFSRRSRFSSARMSPSGSLAGSSSRFRLTRRFKVDSPPPDPQQPPAAFARWSVPAGPPHT